MQTYKHNSLCGFTLIELSTVLVIIGLIIGAVYAGQSIYKGAELQNILTSESRYIEAAKQFKEKYGYLPGDFPSATSYWGTNAAGCPSSANQAQALPTCNGNGDGMIGSSGIGTSSGYYYWENDLAWQHLADAGLIDGSYSGEPGKQDSIDIIPGVNAPATKRLPGGFEWYSFSSNGTYAGTNNWFANVAANYYQQYLLLGSQMGQGGDLTGYLITGPEAHSIDSKIDDGVPNTGTVTSSENGLYTYPCVTSSTSPYAYSTTSNSECSMLFQVNW